MLKLNPHISVDCVVFGFDYKYLKVLLVERTFDYESSNKKDTDFKLPGALISDQEELDEAAYRVLFELTGIKDIFLKRFDVFGNRNRMQNPVDVKWLRNFTGLEIERVVTIAYYSLVKLTETSLDKNLTNIAHWVNINEISKLAFDHNLIINSALNTLRKELRTEPIGFELLPKRFSIRQVQNLYEVILGCKLDNRNFRKRFLRLKYFIPLNEKEEDVNHKPAQLYRFDKLIYDKEKNKTQDFIL